MPAAVIPGQFKTRHSTHSICSLRWLHCYTFELLSDIMWWGDKKWMENKLSGSHSTSHLAFLPKQNKKITSLTAHQNRHGHWNIWSPQMSYPQMSPQLQQIRCATGHYDRLTSPRRHHWTCQDLLPECTSRSLNMSHFRLSSYIFIKEPHHTKTHFRNTGFASGLELVASSWLQD